MGGKRHSQQAYAVRSQSARSQYGYYYAGDTTKINTLAYHITARTKPEFYEILVAKWVLDQQPGSSFVDIGANTGLYCLAIAQLCPSCARIDAFEPQPTAAKELSRTVALNHWTKRLHVHSCALSDSPGKLTLYLAGTGSSFDKKFATGTQEAIAVDVKRLDDFKCTDTAVIKIDVESHEYSVLLGASETIARCRPVMLIEMSDNVPEKSFVNKNFHKTLKLLEGWNYKIFRISATKKLHRINAAAASNEMMMCVCIPAERKGLENSLLRKSRSFRLQFFAESLAHYADAASTKFLHLPLRR